MLLGLSNTALPILQVFVGSQNTGSLVLTDLFIERLSDSIAKSRQPQAITQTRATELQLGVNSRSSQGLFRPGRYSETSLNRPWLN